MLFCFEKNVYDDYNWRSSHCFQAFRCGQSYTDICPAWNQGRKVSPYTSSPMSLPLAESEILSCSLTPVTY